MADDLRCLLSAAQTGRQEALDQFVRLTQDRVYRYALARRRNGDRAADAAQETYVRFLQRMEHWRQDVDPLAWLFAFARRVVLENQRRSPTMRLIDVDVSSGDEPWQRMFADDTKRQLWQAIASLPARQQDVVALRVFQGLTVEQSAHAMRCRPGTVKATMHKAVANLRKRLK